MIEKMGSAFLIVPLIFVSMAFAARPRKNATTPSPPAEESIGFMEVLEDCDMFCWTLTVIVIIAPIIFTLFVLYTCRKNKEFFWEPKNYYIECEMIDLDPPYAHVKPADRHNISVFMEKQLLLKGKDLAKIHVGILKAASYGPQSEEREAPYKKLAWTRYRDRNIKLKPENALQPYRLHGNLIRTRMNTRFYAMQAPTMLTEHTEDTRLDFLDMVVYENVKYIVMLCNKANTGSYFCNNAGESFKIGPYTIKTASKCIFGTKDKNGNPVTWGNAIIVRELEISKEPRRQFNFGKNFGKKEDWPTRTVTHFQYTKWRGKGLPSLKYGYDPCFVLLRTVTADLSTIPVIVHCKYGTGPTMSFIGLEYISRLVEIWPEKSFSELAMQFVAKRYHAFDNLLQIYWLQIGVIRFLEKSNQFSSVSFDMWATFIRRRRAQLMRQLKAYQKKGIPVNVKALSKLKARSKSKAQSKLKAQSKSKAQSKPKAQSTVKK
ncbi:unnamed protein product [Caenorhabditis nigoni]